MNRNQFELLSLIEREGKKKLTQRYMAEETGMSLGWKFLKFWAFDVYIACDIGYYMQLVETHYQPGKQTIGFNGIMLRPKLMTELNIGKWYGISLGVFYQFPLYPFYNRYQGVGIMVSIL